LSLDNRLINQAFFVAAVTVFRLFPFLRKDRSSGEAERGEGLIDYRGESIDPASSLMSITRNLVAEKASQIFQSRYFEHAEFHI